ncbi:hypothetical protein, partial [Methanoculleus sp. UBA416]|uniref:hypothetical protein n=1 Tax=Methanoculleus sp. UBA416 TaxID=1915510 RepID=UPI00319E4A74
RLWMWIRGVCREGDPETPQPGGGYLSKNFVLLMHPPFRRVHLPIPPPRGDTQRGAVSEV